MPPHFRPARAVLDGHKKILRWPGPFGSGFLSPQPPGIVGIGPDAASTPDWANEGWSFLFLGTTFVSLELRARSCRTAILGCRSLRVCATRGPMTGSAEASKDDGSTLDAAR